MAVETARYMHPEVNAFCKAIPSVNVQTYRVLGSETFHDTRSRIQAGSEHDLTETDLPVAIAMYYGGDGGFLGEVVAAPINPRYGDQVCERPGRGAPALRSDCCAAPRSASAAARRPAAASRRETAPRRSSINPQATVIAFDQQHEVLWAGAARKGGTRATRAAHASRASLREPGGQRPRRLQQACLPLAQSAPGSAPTHAHSLPRPSRSRPHPSRHTPFPQHAAWVSRHRERHGTHAVAPDPRALRRVEGPPRLRHRARAAQRGRRAQRVGGRGLAAHSGRRAAASGASEAPRRGAWGGRARRGGARGG